MQQAQAFIEAHAGSWIFGHLGYDLKNEIEGLSSPHTPLIAFPDLFLYVPEVVIRLSDGSIHITTAHEDHRSILDAITTTPIEKEQAHHPISIQQTVSREQQLDAIDRCRQHILRGDCYEINLCMQFYAKDAAIDPMLTYERLSELSPNPFSSFYKCGDLFLLCASPERYLMKHGDRIISQPIKGTSPRRHDDPSLDEAQRNYLLQSEKERSENVMIVDLVRNDLSRICEEGSVRVDELFGVYSYPQVHQMTSTISGVLSKGISFTDIIRATFPMGSMTGAPKRKVMELIADHEPFGRGLFSGSVGYISPEGDMDWNVVIRSIQYDRENRLLSYHVGSGITFNSDPKKEYEECLLKAKAIQSVLSQ